MKKYFLILFFILTARISFSQITHHFPHDSATWGQFHGNYWMGLVGFTDFYTAYGDTIIGSNSYIKVFHSDTNLIPQNLFHLIREDSIGKVWIQIAGTDYLLYDFSASVGDTISLWNDDFQNTVLVKLDSINNIQLINGEIRKHFHLTPITCTNIPQLNWIEGIGSETGLFFNAGVCVTDMDFWLTCFSENDTMKYGTTCNQIFLGVNNPDGNSFFDVSQTKEKSFLLSISKNISSDCSLEVFDILGRKVFSEKISQQKTEINLENLPAGCYVFSLRNNKEIFHKKVMVN